MERLQANLALIVIAIVALSCGFRPSHDEVNLGQREGRRVSSRTSATRLPTSSSRPNSALYFINETTGWALIEGGLYGTSDGGDSWLKVNGESVVECGSIQFATQEWGWALCDKWNTNRRSNSIIVTHDGGHSWNNLLELPTPIYTVNFVNQQLGYVSSRWQPLRRTNDGGKTWTELQGKEGLHYVFFINEKTGWGFGGAIWHTSDGGETWAQAVPYDQVEDLWDVAFPDFSTGWIVGKHQVWHTTDGEKWEKATNLPDLSKDFFAVDFVDPTEGWITVSDGSVLHSSDGGSSWQVLAVLPQPARTIRFVTAQKGWMINAKGDLLRSIDGGRKWTSQPPPPT
jgi:photosystem II stability/assembly factor-like uncharacterized protein